ncbi:MAG: hypothetical protein U0401_25270 [Anaerolineae bacterium]
MPMQPPAILPPSAAAASHSESRQRLARRRERLAEDAIAQANPVSLKEMGEAILALPIASSRARKS